MVVKGQLPTEIREAAELYAGCVSGAIEMDEYLNIMASACLTNIKVQKEKQVNVPDEILSDYLDAQALDAFKKSGTGIYSITVYAEKPTQDCQCQHC